MRSAGSSKSAAASARERTDSMPRSAAQALGQRGRVDAAGR